MENLTNNRFSMAPCQSVQNETYKGYVAPMVASSDQSLVLFFPVQPEVASMINISLEGPAVPECEPDTTMLSVYQTMVDSWSAGNRFLSGVIMNFDFDPENGERGIAVCLALSSLDDGLIEGLMRVNFVHGIMVAALEKIEIIVSEELLTKLTSGSTRSEEDEDEDPLTEDGDVGKDGYPYDEGIFRIASDIMSQNIDRPPKPKTGTTCKASPKKAPPKKAPPKDSKTIKRPPKKS